MPHAEIVVYGVMRFRCAMVEALEEGHRRRLPAPLAPAPPRPSLYADRLAIDRKAQS
jgi:hypothetical protein